jgi:hypothetical protein
MPQEKFVTAADGYPDATPGTFYLFDGMSGNQLWKLSTSNMNWPMQIAANGQGIVGGSDNSYVYYFLAKIIQCGRNATAKERTSVNYKLFCHILASEVNPIAFICYRVLYKFAA